MEHESPHVTTLLAELRALAALPVADGRLRQVAATNVLALSSADLLELLRREAAANPALEVVEHRRRPAHGNRIAWSRIPPPDVVISRESGSASQRGFAIQVTESTRFTVRLRPQWLKRHIATSDPRAALAEGDRQYVQQAVARARLCVALVHQRQQLLARLTRCLVDRQWEALQRGVVYLTPLARGPVAFRAGMNEATLTRAIAGKFCQLPTGAVVPFSRFFQADPTITQAIREIVANEVFPLTDEEIAQTLRFLQIAITPDMVVAYRDQAGIPPAWLRGMPILEPPPHPEHQLAGVAGDQATPSARAEELLCDVLSAPEREQLTRSGFFDVRSPGHAHRFYRIPSHAGRVKMFEAGRPICELCIVPLGPLPRADVIVMHKLLIQGDEEAYLRTANRFPVYVPLAQRTAAEQPPAVRLWRDELLPPEMRP